MQQNLSVFSFMVSSFYILFKRSFSILQLQRCSMLLLLLSRSVMSNSLQPHGLQPTMLLCPWSKNSPGKNTGVGSHSLLQQLCYYVLLASTIHQNASVIKIYPFPFLLLPVMIITVHLVQFPVLDSRFSLVIQFIYNEDIPI